MSENLRQFTKAVYGMDHVMRTAPDDRWDSASPCDGWSGRDVAGHAIGTVLLVESMARGTAAPSGEPAEIAGADPTASWTAARDGVLEALDHQGVLHKVVQSPFGEMPLDDFLGVMVVDTLTHSWDVARAVGADDRLDPGLVAVAHQRVLPLDEMLRGAGYFKPKLDVPDGADEQTAFLRFLGRVS